ncbi:polyprenyl synthetase family protein [Lacrimispora sp. JR3]|uniref:polyprenyl synthetase family protein n=1 Tax=Lacrimispora sinapis TaxID=3111456 RepID=UPI00374A8D4B
MVKIVNFKEMLSARTQEVRQVVEAYMPSVDGYQKTVLEAMDYSVRAGGKRLRPMLMEETYRLFGGKGKEIEPFMAAIEMIHTSSLIHDDLPCMDNDTLRRGLPTAWVKFGYDMAVLAGDGLLIYAMETAAKALSLTDRPDRVARCMGLLAEKTGIFGMIGGQTVDVELAGKPIPEEKLDFIYRLKTGALLEASMMIGAILGGAEEEQLKLVEKMALLVGMAFQIQDDILDLTSSDEVLGKPVLSDEKNHKTTYVSLHGMTKAKQDVEIMSEEAVACLQELPGTNEFLEELIRMLVNRKR